MKEEPNLQEILATMPKEKYLIDVADHLFKSEDKSRNIRFSHSSVENKDSIKIIIEDKLTLFFYKKDEVWEYDGWEMGDYTEDWIDKNL